MARVYLSGHASAAAAAHANLDIIEREGIVTRGLAIEAEIPSALAPLLAHELVSEIRAGFGAVGAIQMDEIASGLAGALDDVAATR